MLRVAKEVRIFPILDYNNNQYVHLKGVKVYIVEKGFVVDIEEISYEFQKGGNKMLRIYRKEDENPGVDEIVYKTLDELHISYELTLHEAAHSIEDCEEIVHKLGEGVHCKNLFLCNRQETEFFLLLMRFDKKFRTADVSKQINRARLSFAKDDYLFKYLKVRPGAVTPMGLIFDNERQVNLLIDKDLLEYEKIYFHPCVNTASILIKMEDFLNNFLPYTKHRPEFIVIS